MKKNNHYLKTFIYLCIICVIPFNLFAFNNDLDSVSKNNSIDSYKIYNIEIIGMGCVNFLLFDKMESEPIYYNGLSPSIKIIFREQNNLGIGIEYSPFLSKKSTLFSNLDENERVNGEYFVHPVILNFNYKIKEINIFFGFGFSRIYSSIFSGNELINSNSMNSAVYVYGTDYSFRLSPELYLGGIVKSFYHSNIDKFNFQIGSIIKYIFSF